MRAAREDEFPGATAGDKVYIVILNWNGWTDTIECLESVLRLGYERYQIVVCDNGSSDGSLERIREWAAGRLSGWVAPSHPLRGLSHPPIPKPVPFVEYSRPEAEAGGGISCSAPLVLIRVGENLGFAGGNNVGMRFALARGDAGFVWLLNNDTVVCPDALSRMVERLDERPRAGMCGSTLLFYGSPDRVQARGGFEYNRWLGTSRQLDQLARATSDELDQGEVESRMYGVQGASVLVTERFLRVVGLLSERYFLYFEEQDWATRASRLGFEKAYAARSIVYHKEGMSTGANSLAAGAKSRLSDYYSIRSRLVFTRSYYPYAFPVVALALTGTILNRVRRRQFDRVPMVLRLLWQSMLG